MHYTHGGIKRTIPGLFFLSKCCLSIWLAECNNLNFYSNHLGIFELWCAVVESNSSFNWLCIIPMFLNRPTTTLFHTSWPRTKHINNLEHNYATIKLSTLIGCWKSWYKFIPTRVLYFCKVWMKANNILKTLFTCSVQEYNLGAHSSMSAVQEWI